MILIGLICKIEVNDKWYMSTSSLDKAYENTCKHISDICCAIHSRRNQLTFVFKRKYIHKLQMAWLEVFAYKCSKSSSGHSHMCANICWKVVGFMWNNVRW